MTDIGDWYRLTRTRLMFGMKLSQRDFMDGGVGSGDVQTIEMGSCTPYGGWKVS